MTSFSITLLIAMVLGLITLAIVKYQEYRDHHKK